VPLKVNPFLPFFTNSCMLLNLIAKQGMPEPSISTTFIGKSTPEEL